MKKINGKILKCISSILIMVMIISTTSMVVLSADELPDESSIEQAETIETSGESQIVETSAAESDENESGDNWASETAEVETNENSENENSTASANENGDSEEAETSASEISEEEPTGASEEEADEDGTVETLASETGAAETTEETSEETSETETSETGTTEEETPLTDNDTEKGDPGYDLSSDEVILQADDELVIALDPGHDSVHAGDSSFGSNEADLTLVIAYACKAELEKYDGVKVILTRSGSACPYGGGTSSACLVDRVSYAQSCGADVFISMHLNAYTGSNRGTDVFYPNPNYRSDLSQIGYDLACSVQNRLVNLGISRNGVTCLYIDDGRTYPDGSTADYYSVIRNSKICGFAGILIEHCYMDNESDYWYFLSDNTKLAQLGIADALGIADYYGLKEKTDETDNALPKAPTDVKTAGVSSGIKIGWTAAEDVSLYRIYRRKQNESKWTGLGNSTGTYYVDKTAENDVVYEYAVKSVIKVDGNSVFSDYSETASGIYLSRVSDITIKNTDEGISLSWPKAKTADGYYVYRIEPGAEQYTRLTSLTGTSYTDKNAKAGQEYYYVVRSYKVLDGTKILSSYEKPGTYAMYIEAPEMSSVTIKSGLLVKWTKAENADLYRVYRRKSGAASWTALGNTSELSFIDTTAAVGTVYEYAVRAVKRTEGQSSIFSDYSDTYSAVYLTEPETITLKNTTKGVSISWTEVKNADGYYIYRCDVDSTQYTRIAILNGTVSSYTDRSASEDEYYYVIRSYKYVDGIRYVSGYTKPGTYINRFKVTEIKASIGDTYITLSWDTVVNAEKYCVYRKTSETGSWKAIAITKNLSYKDTNVKTDQEYYYSIKCIKTVDSRSTYGVYSDEKLAMILSSPNVTLVNDTAGIKITWGTEAKAAGYRIYRKENSTDSWTKLKDVKASVSEYTDTTAEYDKEYYYTVRAYVSLNGTTTWGLYNKTGVSIERPELIRSGIMSGKEYCISSVLGDCVLDISGTYSTEGAAIALAAQDSDNSQRFILQSQGNGYYYIRNVRSWKVLDIKNSSSSNGAAVIQSTCSGASTQLWKIVYTDNSYKKFNIVNKNGKYLKINGNKSADGVKIIIWAADSSDAECFTFSEVDSTGGLRLYENGIQALGIRNYSVSSGNVTQNGSYYEIQTSITLPSGDYYLDTSRIGIKVIYVNNFLVENGYLPESYKDYTRYTSVTKTAVMNFQTDKKLVADGIVGPTTWAAMGYSESDYVNLGAYVTPMKVTRFAANREDYINAMIDTAKAYVGTKYGDGASGAPGSYVDCSGLVFQCLYAAGIYPDLNVVDHSLAVYEFGSRYLAEDSKLGVEVSEASIQPGDLVFYSCNDVVNHVAIYIGDGKIIDATPEHGVAIRNLNDPSTLSKIIRVF